MENLGLILGALGVILLSTLWRRLIVLVWRPYVIAKKFRKQGVMGPDYKFGVGNSDEVGRLQMAAMAIELDPRSHDFLPRIIPHLAKWTNEYGGLFLYWNGPEPSLCITNAEHARQILSNRFGCYDKPRTPSLLLRILGRGLSVIDGPDWARHRKVISPAFTMNKLKMMTKQMAECTRLMLDKWHDQIVQAEGEQQAIEVGHQFVELTADVISHAAFGNSYTEGKDVFSAQRELQHVMLASFGASCFPGSEYLPTKRNRHIWKLDRQMRKKLTSIIQSRMNSKDSGYGNDLLGLMIESIRGPEGLTMTVNEMIDECKTFFFGGHETTSHLLTWTTFLLSTNPEWQEKLREEVMGECGTEIPNADNLTKFKLVTMVLQESLRLYSPVVFIARVAVKDMKLGDIVVPKGTGVTIPLALIQRNKEHWGEDANEFNPLRFQNGVMKAGNHPNSMVAFSLGPRSCIGQDFAMMEAKIAIAMVLQRFSFSLSPEYKHKPANLLTLQPQEGIPIIFKPLNPFAGHL